MPKNNLTPVEVRKLVYDFVEKNPTPVSTVSTDSFALVSTGSTEEPTR